MDFVDAGFLVRPHSEGSYFSAIPDKVKNDDELKALFQKYNGSEAGSRLFVALREPKPLNPVIVNDYGAFWFRVLQSNTKVKSSIAHYLARKNEEPESLVRQFFQGLYASRNDANHRAVQAGNVRATQQFAINMDPKLFAVLLSSGKTPEERVENTVTSLSKCFKYLPESQKEAYRALKFEDQEYYHISHLFDCGVIIQTPGQARREIMNFGVLPPKPRGPIVLSPRPIL